MISPFLLHLIIIVGIALLVGLWIWLVLRSSQANLRTYLKRQEVAFQEKFARVCIILETGGPHNRREYFEIFPEACPRCGSRTRYEYIARAVWQCSRCRYSNNSKLTSHMEGVMRRISSPYLEPEIAEALPELPFAPSELYKQIFTTNNDVTPMEAVVKVLEQVFDMPRDVATTIMLETHFHEHSYVMTLPTTEAGEKIKVAMQMAREQGYPIVFTTEVSSVN